MKGRKTRTAHGHEPVPQRHGKDHASANQGIGVQGRRQPRRQGEGQGFGDPEADDHGDRRQAPARAGPNVLTATLRRLSAKPVEEDHHEERRGRKGLGEQGQGEEKQGDRRAPAVQENRTQGEHQRRRALELGDPGNGLDVRGMQQEKGRPQGRRPGANPTAPEQEPEQGRRPGVEQDIHPVVTPDVGTEKLPLHGVQGEMNRRVVLHQLGHFAGGIPDRPCVREARRVDVLVVRHIMEIVGDELPFKARGIDE